MLDKEENSKSYAHERPDTPTNLPTSIVRSKDIKLDDINELMNNVNCMDAYDLINKLPDKSIDLLLTDPPYKQSFALGRSGSLNHKYSYRQKEIEKISNFDPAEFLENIKPKLKIFNAYIWTSKNLLPEYINFAIENNFNWDILVWTKKNPIPAYHNKYLSDIEFCLYIRKKLAFFNNNLKYDDYRKSMIDNVSPHTGHPTTKHLWMIRKMLKVSSREEDIVFDPFAGSGTTAVACQELNRNFIGSEHEEKYCKIWANRISNKPLFNH